ncbi:MAG: PadR family transcriptional regulator [Propionibacteriaceae bacterium]
MTDHDPQMLKGVLSLLLLSLCAEREDYGYSLVVRLQSAGFDELAEGSVYPALTRLESRGLLEGRLMPSPAGPARKYYAITPDGRLELARTETSWLGLVRSVAAVLTSNPTPQGAPR